MLPTSPLLFKREESAILPIPASSPSVPSPPTRTYSCPASLSYHAIFLFPLETWCSAIKCYMFNIFLNFSFHTSDLSLAVLISSLLFLLLLHFAMTDFCILWYLLPFLSSSHFFTPLMWQQHVTIRKEKKIKQILMHIISNCTRESKHKHILNSLFIFVTKYFSNYLRGLTQQNCTSTPPLCCLSKHTVQRGNLHLQILLTASF